MTVNQSQWRRRGAHSLGTLIIVLAALVQGAYPESGEQVALAMPAGAVTFAAITPFAALDSNNACAAGPRAMYLQVNVTNPAGGSAGALTGVSVDFNGFSNGNFTLDSGESPARYVGNLADGATVSLYWFVNYTCTIGASSNYTLSASDSTAGTVTSGTLSISTRSELSAAAGGDVFSAVVGAGAVAGQVVKTTVNYAFGNPAAGADAMFQPAGNTSFDSSCYRLLSVDITTTTFTAGPTTSNDNRLYFTGVTGGSSNSITVDYYFLALCSGPGSPIDPFADLRSGGQVKYTSNFGTCTSTPCDRSLPPPSNPFVMAKSASTTFLSNGGTLTYTVTLTNTSAFTATLDAITDTLPAGATYGALTAASQVTAVNSSSIPSSGASGTVNWIGKPTTACVNDVCDGIYQVGPNATLTLQYTVILPSSPGYFTNTAAGQAAPRSDRLA